MSSTHRFGRQGQRFVVHGHAGVSGVLGCLVARSVAEVADDNRLFIPILKTKTDTILHAIRPPPSNLHSFPENIELNSPSRPAGQHLVVSELAVVGLVLGCLKVRSVTYVQSLKLHTTIDGLYL